MSRPRNDVDDDMGPSTFEKELMMLDETDDLDEAVIVDESDIVTTESKITLPRSWLRPPVAPIDPSQDKIIFQQIDVDFYKGEKISKMPGPNHSPVPIIRVYGVTESGNSVVAHVHGFMPYFYVAVPQHFNIDCLPEFRKQLNLVLHRELKGNQAEDIQDLVLKVDLVEKESKLFLLL